MHILYGRSARIFVWSVLAEIFLDSSKLKGFRLSASSLIYITGRFLTASEGQDFAPARRNMFYILSMLSVPCLDTLAGLAETSPSELREHREVSMISLKV